VIRNPELARSLRAIAERGRAGFYEGRVGAAVVAAMNAGGHPITQSRFAEYEPQWKRPLCATYRGRTVLSAPPPQTGAQVIHTLKLLEPHDLAAAGLPTRSARAFDILVSALRVAMADNRGTNDDPRWVDVPAHGRTTGAFADRRTAARRDRLRARHRSRRWPRRPTRTTPPHRAARRCRSSRALRPAAPGASRRTAWPTSTPDRVRPAVAAAPDRA
jgi:gamma-glutamyltranspeptidase